MGDVLPDQNARGSGVPWHLWVVGVLGLLWNLFGAYDYVMSNLRDAEYLKNFPPEMAAWLDGLTTLNVSAWAIGVWASVAGSLLLLARSRHAVTAFAVSFVGAVMSFVLQYGQSVPAALDTTGMKVMTAAIIVVIALLWLYARRMRGQGLLR